MALLCGSALITFPSTSFPSQFKNATAKSSSFFPFQLPLPKLSSSSSPSYSIPTHFSSNSFGTTFHVRCEQQQDSSFVGLTKGNPFHPSVDDKLEKARTPHSEVTPASSIANNSDGPVVQHHGNAIANKAGELFEGSIGVNVSVELSDGEYVLRIKRRKISSSTDEDMAERFQSAGMLFLQAELIREMAEQLLAQYRASLRSIFIESAT